MLVAQSLLLCILLPALTPRDAVIVRYRDQSHDTICASGFSLLLRYSPIGYILVPGSALRGILGDELVDMYSDAASLSEYLMIVGLFYLSFVVGDILSRTTRIRTADDAMLAQICCPIQPHGGSYWCRRNVCGTRYV
jgi:hypothetical protein